MAEAPGDGRGPGRYGVRPESPGRPANTAVMPVVAGLSLRSHAKAQNRVSEKCPELLHLFNQSCSAFVGLISRDAP